MERWDAFVSSILQHVDTNLLDNINIRFQYGELRLNRLNQIYRFAPRFRLRHLIFAYSLYPNEYSSFLKRNFGWIFIVFAYASIILSALQVGLATDSGRDNATFQGAAYGFGITCIFAPLVTALLAFALYSSLFIFHVTIALRFVKVRKKKIIQSVEQKRNDTG